MTLLGLQDFTDFHGSNFSAYIQAAQGVYQGQELGRRKGVYMVHYSPHSYRSNQKGQFIERKGVHIRGVQLSDSSVKCGCKTKEQKLGRKSYLEKPTFLCATSLRCVLVMPHCAASLLCKNSSSIRGTAGPGQR